MAVQWLNEALCFVSSSVLADSIVLRNRQLLVAAKPLHSGVHATITVVLLAFAIPFGNGGEKSPSYILQYFLHKPVAFFILPLFAVANTCISVGDSWQSSLGQTNSLGIMAGLVIGKPLGIWLFSFIGVGLGLCALPTDLKWKNIIGAGFFRRCRFYNVNLHYTFCV